MKKKGTVRSKRRSVRAVFYLVVVVLVALVIEFLILNSLNKKSFNNTSLVLLNQVANIIRDNDQSESELIETLKEDYMIRAQTVSYILDSKPEAEKDIPELKKIAEMMRIDEIHLFNQKGEIYSGTEKKYYGYSFDSGEQMEYFKPMLKDKTLTMCQDVMPNTAEGKSMMYAIVWSEAGDKMVQVGIEPVRLLEELRSNEITEVIADIPTYEGINIWVAEADSGKVYASTDEDDIGRTMKSMGLTDTDYSSGIGQDTFKKDGYTQYCNLVQSGDYVVVVGYSVGNWVKSIAVSLVIEFVYLLLAGLVIMYMFRRVVKANDERNDQMAILVSMSDIYNSMHLIDLETNTFTEYHARAEVSKVVKSSDGADETMKQLMIMTTERKYCESALAFTDIHSIADRMKNKKILSKEFMSKAIGWYRGSFITIEADLEGRPTKLVYVTQNIDKEKKKEEELLYKSHMDELTGLHNRRAYEDSIAEHSRIPTEENFVFVSLDVNGLKTVNDTKGHAAGDELLIGAATCMKRCFGPYGRVYRVGGDEFAAIIFANQRQLEHIKKDFAETTGQWSGDLVKSISVSSGYVTKQEAGEATVHEIAEMADKKMYEAKARYYEKHDRRAHR